MDFKLNKSNLNFRVYTASTTPETGTGNDIVVISDVAMKNWVLSPDAPSGAPRADGDVWIQYAVSGNMVNALKQNALMLAPVATFQYKDGAWVNVPFVGDHSGGTEAIKEYLYEAGDEATTLTGGWDKNTALGAANGSVNKNTDSIAVVRSGLESGTTVVATQKAIDLTSANTISINTTEIYISATASYNAKTYLYIIPEGKTLTEYAVQKSLSEGIVSVDISDLSGKYIVAVGAYTYNSSSTARVTFDKVWLE